MKEPLQKPELEEPEQIDFFEEEDNTDILLDEYKDLELEFVKSTKKDFLTWNDY